MPLSLTLLIITMGVGLIPWPGPLSKFTDASESPERECCDPIYPLLTPTASTVINPTSLSPTVPGPVGPNVQQTVEVMKCLLAKHLCENDPTCSIVIKLLPTLCGIEQVACSTVTVVKCQAALRMLQSYQYFRPTCLCREKSKEPECNQFRDMLFDHPCIYVLQKEKDPYPVNALPTCNHALTVCQLEPPCIKRFDDFKLHCKVRDGTCRMENRQQCLDAWTNLRMTPMFGCICPNNPMKRRCDRIFNLINHNPCIGRKRRAAVQAISGDDKDFLRKYEKMKGTAVGAVRVYGLSSTCHFSLMACQEEKECGTLIRPFLHHCDNARCNRLGCMKAMQNFYRNSTVYWGMEVAYCLCRRSDNGNDKCLIAQEQLHPVCPQQVDGELPTCHAIANACKEDRSCRMRLEYFEQACAVDSITKKCSGPTDGCRRAMLGILGTELRINCACKGTDYIQLYECLGWQRLLWLNPCVVEAQKDYHTQRSKILPPELYKYSQIISPVIPWNPMTNTFDDMKNETEEFTNGKSVSRVGSSDTTALSEVNIRLVSHSEFEAKTETPRPPQPPPVIAPNITAPIVTTTTTTTTTTTATTTTTPATTVSTTSTTTTTTTLATTTLPPKYCLVERARQTPQYVLEGAAKRLYKDDEPECSEVCHCQMGEHLECRTICVKRAACKSEFAFYNHAAPAYQAYRGRCMCYSGRFICMRPHPDHYSIPHGIFLFLGYSEADEILLKPHNNLSVIDIASTLQQILSQMHNKTSCTLEIFNITKENLIIVAHPIKTSNASLKNQELVALSKECAEQLQDLSDKINSKDPEVHSHLLLSILKLAEVEVKVPEAVSDTSRRLIPNYPFEIFVASLAVFYVISS